MVSKSHRTDEEHQLTRLKNGGHSYSRAYALSQHDLVVFGTQASHHDAEDVEQTADQDQTTGTVVIE